MTETISSFGATPMVTSVLTGPGLMAVILPGNELRALIFISSECVRPADLQAMPRTRLDVKDEGRTVVYEGVLVRPQRIIAPKDSRVARSVRMLQRLEVMRLKK